MCKNADERTLVAKTDDALLLHESAYGGRKTMTDGQIIEKTRLRPNETLRAPLENGYRSLTTRLLRNLPVFG